MATNGTPAVVSDADKAAIVEDVLLLQAKLAEMADQVDRVRRQNTAMAEENEILKRYLASHGAPGPEKPS